jgi:hypothetical protein
MKIVSRPPIDFHDNYEDYEDYDYEDYEDDYDDEQVPRPPILQLRRPPASAKIPSTLRWRPIPWTGIPLLEDIQEIKSQESLEIRS